MPVVICDRVNSVVEMKFSFLGAIVVVVVLYVISFIHLFHPGNHSMASDASCEELKLAHLLFNVPNRIV